MKKFTMLMAFLLLISWYGVAQISTYYSFSELNNPYVDITGGTIDLVADSDDGEVINVPIGFSFNYAGTLYTSLTIGVNGALSFTSNDVSFSNSLSATGATQTNVIAPLWDDMFFRTVDNAEIMYLTTGVAPNRVFTVQWKNISWRNPGNTVNFQVQLFENTNNIQFNYGALNSTDSRTASIGFNKGTSGTDFISVTPGIPATSSFITDDNNINTTQYPGNGAVYLFTFTPPACPDPSVLSATNLTATSADLTWTEMGSATTWDIEWGTAGFTPTGTPNIVGTTTNPHNLTGLTANTSYDFYVRADCAGNGTSNWSGPYNFTTPCASQLAGTYTIGATGNYATFTDAVNALSCGISAPVVFNVLTGSGPYNEQVTITPVTGASATNTITFNGNGDTITSSTLTGSRSLFLLDGAKHVTINDLVFVPQSSTNNFTVQLTNGADSNTVNNCTIDLTAAISSSVTSNAGIVISGSLTSATSTTQPTGNYNVISNNTVIGGYYGIAVSGGNNNNITNNDVQDVYYYGLYHSAVNNTNTSNNKVSRPNRTSVSTIAYYAIYYTGSSENNLTNANELFNPLGSTTSTPTTYLIGHSSADATVGNENIVTNNIIHSVSGNATVYGLYNSGSDGVFYYHNTVSLDDANATAGTTRGFYQTTLASGIEFKNNIITITRGGTGTKYCIYFGTSTSTITSDNNVFYINAPAGTNSLGYFSATAQATLVDWQTASSQDASSSDADPIYANLLSNDYTPTNSVIDNMADASVGVANDFFGAARAATPDVGAIEFTPPSCAQPSALTATNITATSADLGWTENGTATTWDIEWGTAGFTPTGTPTIVGTTTNPHNLTGLTAQTSYDFYVRADCGGSGTSTWVGPFTFTTECAVITPDHTEPFNTFVPNSCWDEADGGDLISGPTSIGSSPWGAGTAIGNTAKINLYTDSRSDWILSPYFDLSAGGYEIVLDVAVTNWSSSTSDVMGSDDSVRVVFSEDGLTWDTLMVFTVADNLSNSLTTFSTLIPSTANNVQFGILATDGPNNDSEDYDFHVDNFIIRTPPSCPAPTALTATNITATTADLGWTENGTATTWDIEWGTAGFTPTGTPTIVGTTTNPHNLTGLTAQTSYDFYVRADCGGSGTSTWVGPFTFTTECAAVVAPWVENFENAGAIPACWSQGNTNSENWLFDNSGTGTYIGNGGVITGATTSGNFFAWVDDSTPHSAATTLESPFIDVTALTNPMLSFFLISDNEGDLNVDFSVDVWDGATWNAGVYTSNTNTLNGGWEQVNVYLSSLTINGDIKLRFIVDENNGTDYFDDVAIDDVEIKEAPSCPAPSALTIINLTPTSVDLGWTENGSAANWQVEWDTTGFVQGTGNIAITGNNPFNVTGLTPFTSYEFYVRSICGTNDTSAWSGPYTFAYNHCTPTYTYGCTNGARVNNVITTNGNININNTATECASGAIGYTNYSSAHTLEVSQGATFDINVGISNYDAGVTVWIDYNQDAIFDASEIITQSATEINAGSNHIANITVPVTALLGETRMRVRAVEGSTSFDPCSNYSWGEAEDYKVIILTAITCSDPSNLTAFNIQPTSAMLDWTENGTATNWNIEWDVTGFTLGTGNPQAVAAKPYLLQGLTPGTSYDYYVQADCGMGDTSNWVGPFTFMTPPCMPIGLDLGVDTTLCANQNITLDAGAGNYIYSWSTGGSAQTELIDTTLMGGNGTYNVSVMVTDVVTGCMYMDDINITFQTCTDIDELGNENAISIYPNPTKGLLNVMINGTTVNTTLTIVDVQGKVVYTKNNFTNTTSLVETIDLSGNDKGIYFINLITDKTTVVKKVILH